MATVEFTGRCRYCVGKLNKNRVYPSNPSGRVFCREGYVYIRKNALPQSEWEFFQSIAYDNQTMPEHRWVMAKHLGRRLKSNELVDHMDGDKTNNNLWNLRIYIRGRQMPGSHNGYGTYYHEWQMAEQRVRELEAENARLLAELTSS